jgi:hypothetical protein
LFSLKREFTALLKTAFTFKEEVAEENFFFHNIKCSDIDLKKVLGLKFSMYFKYLLFNSKKACYCAFL